MSKLHLVKRRILRLVVQLNPEERELIRRAAKRDRRSYSDFIRAAAIRAAAKDQTDWERHREILRQHIGEPINVY
jgi:uncharacterized protein (DUF1778 family)